MKTGSGLAGALALLLAVVLAGCATHRIDWKSRVGVYTLDQAVTEFGPPDKQAKLSDGRLVAEWVRLNSYAGSTFVAGGGGYYGHPGAVSVIQSPPTYYESRLRLIFGTNNVLTAWSKN